MANAKQIKNKCWLIDERTGFKMAAGVMDGQLMLSRHSQPWTEHAYWRPASANEIRAWQIGGHVVKAPML